MAIRVPDRVMLLGREWLVLRVEAVSNEEAPDALGCCDPERRVIELRKDIPEHRLHEVYIHECLHAVFPQEFVSDRIEEAIVTNAEPGLGDAVLALLAENR